MDSEQEYNTTYAIPANYTDSGKLLGGMLEVRNTIEAIIIVGLIGYQEVAWLHIDTTIKIVIMVVTLIPIGVLALMGLGGDSLFQYAGHIIKFWGARRKLHFRRIGYRYGTVSQQRKAKKPAKKGKQNK